MKQVEIPNVGVVEFPPDMTDEQITLAIERDILKTASPPRGLRERTQAEANASFAASGMPEQTSASQNTEAALAAQQRAREERVRAEAAGPGQSRAPQEPGLGGARSQTKRPGLVDLAVARQTLAERDAATPRTAAQTANDTLVALGAGLQQVPSMVTSLVAPQSEAAQRNQRAQRTAHGALSPSLQARLELASQRIAQASEEGLWDEVKAAAHEYFVEDPALAAHFAVQTLPSMLGVLAPAKAAQLVAVLRGAAPATVAKVTAGAAGGANAVMTAGDARQHAYDELYRTFIDAGVSPAEAQERALAESRQPAAVGAGLGYLGGKYGAEAGVLGTAAGRTAAGRAGATVAGEVLTEIPEEVAPQLVTNSLASRVDGRNPLQGLGETAVQTVAGVGPMAAIGGVSAARTVPIDEQFARDVENLEIDPAAVDASARAALDPANAQMERALQQREAEAFARDPIEGLVVQAENAAVRQAAQPPASSQNEGAATIDQDALLAQVEAQQTGSGNVVVSGERAAEAVQAIAPGAPILRRKDGAVLVSTRFSAPVFQAIEAAKQRVSVEFGDVRGFMNPETVEDGAPVDVASATQAEQALDPAEDQAGPEATRMESEWAAFPQEMGTLGIPRAQMPQIKAEHRGAMTNFMNARGVEHAVEEVAADALRPTQAEFSPARVRQAMAREGGDRSILISEDGYVLDGHHQWLAKREAGEPIKVIRLKAPIGDLIKLAHEFPSSHTAAGASAGGAKGSAKGARIKPDSVLAERAQRAADELRAMAQDAGWAEEGGRLLRDGGGQATGRTRWIPRAEWFVSGMETRPDVLAQAIDDVLAGAGVPAKQRRTIEGMIEWLDAQRAGRLIDSDSSYYDLAAAGYDDRPGAVQAALDTLETGFADMSEAEAMAALGFTQEEIDEALAEGRGTETQVRGDDARRAAADEGGRESLDLQAYSAQEVRDREDARLKAEEAAAQRQREAEQRAQADAERESFTLTGSDRPADVLAAQGQGGIFESSGTREANAVEPLAEAAKITQPQERIPESRIADFGEKIGGARKDTWQSYRDALAEANSLDVAAEPLSKSWPAPDYEALLAAGADPFVVAFVHASRDAIPAKPRMGYKVRAWADLVTALRDATSGLMNGALSAETARDALAGLGQRNRAARDIAGRIELYQAVGHAKSLQGVTLQEHYYSLYRGEENVHKWVVEKAAKATAFSNWPRELAVGDSKAQVIEAFKARVDALLADKPASKEVSFDIFSKRGETGYYVGKKIGRNPALLAGPFTTIKEAREYKAAHNAELVERLERFKEIPSERRPTNEPRVGEDMRGGQDVTPELFADTFGFRGVEFGNWVEQGRRQQDLNDAFDALMDMAAVLGVPPKALSLNGELGLAFGARGTGNAGGTSPNAHYEPGFVVINLTKKRGAGSLGHEWWHALDNYFSRMRGKNGEMITEALDVSLAARGSDFVANTAVRREMVQAFGEVVRTIKATAIKARSAKLDERRSRAYWTTEPEMSARAFESYLISKLQDQDASNDYLANIVSEETWRAAEALGFELDGSYPYPTAGEVPAIRAAFDELFAAVQTKETEKGVALFSRAGGKLPHTAPSPDDFVSAPGGGIDFGEISPEMARAMRRQPGKIRLERGDDTYGERHIELRHGKDIRGVGFDSVAAFVADAVQKIDAVWKPSRTSQLVVVEAEENGKVVFIELKPATDGDYYTVNTAFPTPRAYAEKKEHKEGWVKLWDRMALQSSAPAAQSPSAEQLSGEAGESAAPPSGQSVSSVSPAAGMASEEAAKSDASDVLWPESEPRAKAPGEPSVFAAERADKASGTDPNAVTQSSSSVAGTATDDEAGIQRSVGIGRSRRLTPDMVRGAFRLILPSHLDALDAMLKRGEAGRRGGLVIIDAGDPQGIAEAFSRKTGVPVEHAMASMEATQSDDRGKIQGFYHSGSGLTFLVGPNVPAAAAPAVLLHEAVHGRQRPEIDARAMALIEARAKAVRPVREFLERVAQRMEDAGEAGNPVEATAYLVEQAVMEGREAGFSAADGALLSWIDRKLGKRVGDIVRDFIAMVRAWALRRGIPITPSIDDLVTLARDNLRAMARGDVTAEGEGAAASVSRSRAGQAILTALTAAPPAAAQSAAASPSRAKNKAAELPAETQFQAFQRKTQDQLNRFTVIKAWLKAQGVTLSEQADVHKAEERMHSRFANRAEDFREQVVRPLVEKIQKAGFTLDDVAQFLHAQHAAERNKQIAKINPALPDGGSGMKTEESRGILAGARPELAALANELRAITDSTRQVLLDGGIIPLEMADAWQKAYQHYVPLKGGPKGGGDNGAGKGLKARYKPKRALGHSMREEGEWIIENILADHERALMLAEKNRVGQHLLKMALEVQRDDLLTIGRPEKRGVLKETVAYEVLFRGQVVGTFQTLEAARAFRATAPAAMKNASPAEFGIRTTHDQTVAYMASPMLTDNEALVYVKGNAIRIQIKDELLARAYGKMGVEALPAILAAGRALNGFFSKIYTGYNPEFIVTNVVRDFTTGLANITGEAGAMMAARAFKNYPRAFAQLLKYAVTGKASPMIEQYRADGGNTGAAYLSDLERLGANIQKELAAYQGVIANLKQGSMKGAARALGRKVFNRTLKYIEHLNMAGENAMRVAVYRAAVESGRSRAEAASLAKNSTVNFNRKGEWGGQMNAAWLFYNASVQGTAAIAHAHLKGEHKYQAWAVSSGMAALGYLMAAAIGGSDDEDDYDQLGDFVKERNMVLRAAEGWVKIPVPYGYGFFWNLGRAMADAQRNGDMGKAAWHVAASFVEEFTPFGGMVAGEHPDGAQAFLYALPTAAQIIGAPLANRTSFGGPMMPEDARDGSQPDRDKTWRSTKGTMADRLSGALDMAGLDVSPETLKHLGRTFTGGAGALTTAAIDAVWLKAHGAELDVKEMPFVRKFYTKTDVRDARRLFHEAAGEAREATEAMRRAVKAQDWTKYGDLAKELAELRALDKAADRYRKAIGARRDYIDRIRLSKDYTLAEQRLLIKQEEAKERQLYEAYRSVFKDMTERMRERNATAAQ